MIFLYKHHRIDFNFILAGEYRQLPFEVVEVLGSELSKLNVQP